MNAPAPARRDRLRAMLADLKMPGALEAVDGILSDADGGTISAAEAIEQLLNAQIVLRNNGDTRPLWITGLSPPDSWRSLRQPGYLQLESSGRALSSVRADDGSPRTAAVRHLRPSGAITGWRKLAERLLRGSLQTESLPCSDDRHAL